MAETTQTRSMPQSELLFLEARLDTWCEQFEYARPSLSPRDAKKTEARLITMRQRLNIILLEKGVFAAPQDKIPAMELLDETELEQVAETLLQNVQQYEKLNTELTTYQNTVKKQMAEGKATSLKKAIEELRGKLDAYHKHNSQFRPIEDMVNSAGRQLAGHRDPLQSFLRISSRLQAMTALNQSIQSQYTLKETMSRWLQTQRQRLAAMSFQIPPSEQSLAESASQLTKVASLTESLNRLTRARRYLEGFLVKNGMDIES